MAMNASQNSHLLGRSGRETGSGTPDDGVVPPSKPFLEKNSFYLSSAGFRVHVADDPASQKVMRALPAHRFVMHNGGGVVHYLYAEPNHASASSSAPRRTTGDYRDILARPLAQVDDVSPDYKTQAGALLGVDPTDFNSINGAECLTEFFRTWY
jgi:hypothetical protein